MVQRLGFSAFTAEGQGSTPGWGTKIPQASGQKKINKNTKNYKYNKSVNKTKKEAASQIQRMN